MTPFSFSRLLALLLFFPIALSAQFPIPPSGAGAAVGTASGFELLPFDSEPRVLWSQSEASWLVPLGENLDPALPQQTESTLLPTGAARIGEVVVVVGECRGTVGVPSVCLDRYAEDGSLLESLRIDEASGSPRVASLGNEGLIAFVDFDSGHYLDVVRLDRDGRPGERKRLGPFVGAAAPALAAANGSFHVGWSDGVHQVLEIRDGAFVALTPLRDLTGMGEFVQSLQLAASGEGVLAVAIVQRNDGQGTSFVRARILGGSNGWQEIVSEKYLRNPRVVPVAGGFVVGWMTFTADVRTRLLLTSGSMGPITDVSEGRSGVVDFRLAQIGDRVIALFDSRPEPGALYVHEFGRDARMRVLNASGDPLAPSKIVSLAEAPQLFPRGVFSGNGFTVVWNERDPSGTWRIRGARLDAAGAVIGRIEVPFAGVDRFRPSIAFNGESHFLVWTEGVSGTVAVRGVRLSIDGSVLDSEPLTLLGEGGLTGEFYAPRTASVTWSGTDWIVASSSLENAIVARRFSAAGSPLDPEPVKLTDSGPHRDPQISCAGQTCLLVWRTMIRDHCAVTVCPLGPDSVLAAMIHRDLTNVRRVEVPDADREGRLNRPRIGVGDGGRIDVSWNEGRDAWMVVWSDGPGGRVIGKDGSVSGALPPGGYLRSSAALIPEGSGWRVATIAGFFPGPRTFHGSLITGWSGGTFGSADDLEDQRVLQSRVARDFQLFIDLVAAPRPLALITRTDPETGLPFLSGQFLDDGLTRKRAVRRK